MRCWAVLTLATLGASLAFAQQPGTATPIDSMRSAATVDCAHWTLDGYRLGMRGDEVLAVRSVTLHVEGQAQASEPGRFQGVLVLDGMNLLNKWEVVYQAPYGDDLRAELLKRYGQSTSDVSGTIQEDSSGTVRQRRTIWWSTVCDAALILYENTSVRGTPVHTVNATLARTSVLPPGLASMKTLFR